MMKNKQLRGSLLLLLAAFIWGVAFVAQSVGMEFVGAFTFISVRFLIGGVFLIPCVAFLDKVRNRGSAAKKTESFAGTAAASGAGVAGSPGGEVSFLTGAPKSDKHALKQLLLGGVCCGIALFTAASLQQIGISHTTVGKAGFITALYIIFVPLFGIFLRRFPGLRIWISVMISAIGLYLLCMTEGLHLSVGDTYVFLCAMVFAVHILLIDHFAVRVDPVRLSCVQFLVCGVLAAVPMFACENPQISDILGAAVPILYAAILSSGVAFTLQVVAQKDTNATVASLIMSLESVFSVLAGWVILHQSLSGRELLGCALMFGAIILSQLRNS